MARIIAIGASAGGIEALQTIVSRLPPDFPAPILVVVHIPENHESALPNMLNRAGNLKALHPYNGQPVEPGTIYVAPSNYHMVMIDHHIQLKSTPKENRHRPAIDPLFRSIAQSHDDEVIGVILSGVLDDGVSGLMAIKQQGGVAVVQDPDDAAFSSMPKSACRYVDVDYVLPALQIPDRLTRLAKTEAIQTSQPEVSAQDEIDVTDSKEVTMHNLHDQPGELTPYACPECNGNLWVAKQNGFAQYWCHIGHRYSKRTLLAEKSSKIEAALFESLRNLKEGITLAQDLADEVKQHSDLALLEELEKESELRVKQIKLIQQIIEESSERTAK